MEIVRMSCDTKLQHPPPRPVIQAACQSVSQSAGLFTLVLLTRVSACLRGRVYPQAMDLGEVTARFGPLSAAERSGVRVGSPDRRPRPAGQTTAAANVGHVLLTAYTTSRRADRTRAVRSDVWGGHVHPPSQRG